MKNMDFDYDENEDYFSDIDNLGWEIRINNDIINNFNNKYDAIENIIEELNILSNEKIEEILLEKYIDYNDLINELLNMDVEDFYEYLNCVMNKLDFDHDIRLICLNDEEPEFGEL